MIISWSCVCKSWTHRLSNATPTMEDIRENSQANLGELQYFAS